jgi:threonine/homoserine/homoserine lactone efflux protein
VLSATLHRSAAHGRWAGPLIVAGHAVVEVPLMAAVILGLGELFRARAFTVGVGLGGGAMLIFMGTTMLREAPRLKLSPGQSGAGPDAPLPALSVIASGALTSLSNPYFPIWWATVGLGFLNMAQPSGGGGYTSFYCGHILADLAWYSSVSESVHRGRWFLSDRGYRLLVAACAVLLLAFGAYFAWSAVAALRGTAG